MMKKQIILSIIAIVCIAMIIYIFKPVKGLNDSNQHISNIDHSQQVNLDKKSEQNSASLEPHLENQDVQIIKPISQAELSHYQIPDIFQNHDQGFLFAFDHKVLDAKQQGDHINIEMLKYGINRKATITHIDHVDDDIVKWSGTFDSYPADINKFTITQTLKDHYAILKIFTDRGAYTAEIKDGIGLALPITTAVGKEDGVHEH